MDVELSEAAAIHHGVSVEDVRGALDHRRASVDLIVFAIFATFYVLPDLVGRSHFKRGVMQQASIVRTKFECANPRLSVADAEHQGQQGKFDFGGKMLVGDIRSRTALRLIRE